MRDDAQKFIFAWRPSEVVTRDLLPFFVSFFLKLNQKIPVCKKFLQENFLHQLISVVSDQIIEISKFENEKHFLFCSVLNSKIVF